MPLKQDILTLAREAVLQEATAIRNLTAFINESFATAVETCYKCKGRIVITGIGKSAIIAQKLVATFNSTGAPALYMHAADAIHGDLGMVQPEDVVICISKSGNSPEIKVLIPLLRNMGNTIIGLAGNAEGYLARNCDVLIDSSVDAESCPNNLAPTTSTTAQMVMGDTLAVCLISLRGFSSQDFARFHPGGSLGKKLYTKVADLIASKEAPMVEPTATLKEVILEISSKRLGATAVIENGILKGIITDGDLRRMLEKTGDLNRITARDIMTGNPRVVAPDELAYNAFNQMEELKITQLAVADQGKYLGLVHLHDILKEGIF